MTLAGTDALKQVYTKIRSGLAGVERQSGDTDKYTNLDKGPGVYGVVKRARDNDVHLHTNQTVS